MIAAGIDGRSDEYMTRYDAIVLGVGGVGSAGAVSSGPARGAGAGHRPLSARPRSWQLARPDAADSPGLLRASRLRAAGAAGVSSCGTSWNSAPAKRSTTRSACCKSVRLQGEVLRRARQCPAQHALEIEELAGAASRSRASGLSRAAQHCEAIFEERRRLPAWSSAASWPTPSRPAAGRELHTDETVTDWRAEGGVVVETDRDAYSAERLVIRPAPWAGQLLADLGIPLRSAPQAALLVANSRRHLSGRSRLPGLSVRPAAGLLLRLPANRSARRQSGRAHRRAGRRTIPLTVDRELDLADQEARGRLRRRVSAATPRPSARDHTVCMYTMTPDAHFVVDRHPQSSAGRLRRRPLGPRLQIHLRAGRSALAKLASMVAPSCRSSFLSAPPRCACAVTDRSRCSMRVLAGPCAGGE